MKIKRSIILGIIFYFCSSTIFTNILNADNQEPANYRFGVQNFLLFNNGKNLSRELGVFYFIEKEYKKNLWFKWRLGHISSGQNYDWGRYYDIDNSNIWYYNYSVDYNYFSNAQATVVSLLKKYHIQRNIDYYLEGGAGILNGYHIFKCDCADMSFSVSKVEEFTFPAIYLSHGIRFFDLQYFSVGVEMGCLIAPTTIEKNWNYNYNIEYTAVSVSLTCQIYF